MTNTCTIQVVFGEKLQFGTIMSIAEACEFQAFKCEEHGGNPFLERGEDYTQWYVVNTDPAEPDQEWYRSTYWSWEYSPVPDNDNVGKITFIKQYEPED